MSLLRYTVMMTGALLVAACGGSGSSAVADANPVSVVATPAPAPSPAASPTPSPSTTPASAGAGMKLGVATHFQQGWPIGALQNAAAIGATGIRDEIAWRDVERSAGTYNFTAGNVAYLDEVGKSGLNVTLLLIGGNPLYDGGFTPYTDAGRAAFARFAVAALDRFPNVKTIEIGNEFNGQDFVSGPVQQAGYGERQAYHAAMLKAVYQAVKAKHPEVQILGGATHSIPVGYLKTLFDKGALDDMDGVAIHPYTTPPEQFGKQIAMLRSAMGTRQRPIFVTEYAQELDSAQDTADYLVKMTAVMAESGIAAADWYALRQEGPVDNPWYKKVGLTTQAGVLTPVGRGYQMMAQRVLSQGAARRLAIDDFTYAYAFGNTAVVLWGAPRGLRVSGKARVFNAQGEEIAAPARIALDSPIVIIDPSGIRYGDTLNLDPIDLIADSYDQFTYGNPASPAGRWSYYDFSVVRQAFEPLSPFGGGEVSWTAWTPFMSDLYRRPLYIQPDSMAPADFGSGGTRDVYRTVVRYTAAADQTVRIEASWDVAAQSADGVDLSIAANGRSIVSEILTGQRSTIRPGVRLRAGENLDFIVGPNGTINGDSVRYRIRLYRE